MAVMRLRKLFATPQAVVLEDGKIGLDPQYVWLDLWAFDREVDALHPLLRAQPAEHLVAAIGEHVLALLPRPFLDHESPQRWLLATRERARARFLRTLTDAGRYWEQCGRWPDAAALYERGLDVDPLAEDFYRSLMRCQLAQGRTAEVARTWQRCRDLLEAELGVPPSAETEALFRAALAAEPPMRVTAGAGEQPPPLPTARPTAACPTRSTSVSADRGPRRRRRSPST